MTILIDKEQNKNKSIFSSGDFRHNVITNEDAVNNAVFVKKNPKSFFNWNDDTVFHPKFKRDVKSDKIEKFHFLNNDFLKKSEIRNLSNKFII